MRIHFRGNELFPHGSPTLREFLLDTDHDVKGIQGPVESGKTGGCMSQIHIWQNLMPRCLDGIRRSRFLVSRPTYGELQTSVMRDWEEWFPEVEYGKFKKTEPFNYTMKYDDVESVIDFVSYGDTHPDTIKKLRSTQYTGAWVNEVQFIPLMLLTEIIKRTGRYPSKKLCPDYDRKKRCVFDNNAPLRHDFWLLYMRGDTPIPVDMPEDQKMAYVLPKNWKLYVQPPALLEVKGPTGEVEGYELNPKAENLQNMGDRPYSETGGLNRDDIDRDYRNITRTHRGNNARYPKFSRDHHVAKGPIQPYEGAPIGLGIDFGLTPGVVFGQHVDGRYAILYELVLANAGAEELAPLIKQVLNERFGFYRETGIWAIGDPSGGWRLGNSVSNSSFSILQAHGIPVKAPWKKDKPDLRMELGRKIISEFDQRGAKLQIDPGCVNLINALDGGMVMKQTKVEGTERITETLVKNVHSHIGEGFEYFLVGGGEAKEMIRRAGNDNPRGPVMTAGPQTSPWGAQARQDRVRRKGRVFKA